VHLRTDPYRIVVSLSGHSVAVYRGNTRLLSTAAVVGKPASPTPTGSFFVDAIIPLAYDGGPYGAGAMGVAAFSDVYETFGGGPGQIAIHGTNEPGLLGQSASHGCVRIANDQWRKITSIVPTGTPVQINA
jgi:lipoprotein-anchoring transpeptidase ErfK/SrfK